MLFGTQHDDGFRVQLDAVLLAPSSSTSGLNARWTRTVGRNAFATFTAECRGGVHGQARS
jgi:hypothetical protein